MPDLKYDSWHTGGSDTEAAESIDRLQVRLDEMEAEGWEIQHSSIAVSCDGAIMCEYIWRRD